MRAMWRSLSVRQRVGTVLLATGICLTVLLAFLGNASKPPSASTQALLALLAIMAQVGAAWVFSGEGKADPTLAQRSVARLIRYATRAQTGRQLAEGLLESGSSPDELRDGMGHLSVHLSYLEDGYVEAIEDWRMFHSKAVSSAELNDRKSIDDE